MTVDTAAMAAEFTTVVAINMSEADVTEDQAVTIAENLLQTLAPALAAEVATTAEATAAEAAAAAAAAAVAVAADLRRVVDPTTTAAPTTTTAAPTTAAPTTAASTTTAAATTTVAAVTTVDAVISPVQAAADETTLSLACSLTNISSTANGGETPHAGEMRLKDGLRRILGEIVQRCVGRYMQN
jgi:hypothetical protein